MQSNLVPVLVPIAQVRDFVLAGNSLFTIANMGTGKHFTFQVQAPKEQRDPKDPVHFVKVLSGPDNRQDYELVGMLFSGAKYVHWKKSHMGKDCPSEIAFVWLVSKLLDGDLPKEVQIFHHGYCGRCGALLTTVESLQRGLGPKCCLKDT